MRQFWASILPLFLATVALAGKGNHHHTTGTPERKVPPGFATVKDGKFSLDGKPYAFVGSNSYWLPLLTTKEDVELTLKDIKAAGIKVMRTWAFNAINATELPGALESGLTYYQIWNGSRFDMNYGPQGLERLDYYVEAAERHGIKLILTFTNNWVGYGGAELYNAWIRPDVPYHDIFYTDEAIIAEYQRYVKIIVDRYKDSPTVFAWELMNEARCLGDQKAGPDCPYKRLISPWYERQANYVRSLDPYHMITTGGEGHFFWDDPPKFWYNGTLNDDYNYDGEAGEDFDGELALENIDFGTYHLYVTFWYPQLIAVGNFSICDWGSQWIQQHADSAKKIGKPVILEEFGLAEYADKMNCYPQWVQKALDTETAGILPWQYGQLGLTEGDRIIKYADAIIDGASPNDGLAIYKNETALYSIFTDAAKVQDSRSG